nr:hypothetical protein Iba_chr09cCG9150 [Ipomoea batatas]
MRGGEDQSQEEAIQQKTEKGRDGAEESMTLLQETNSGVRIPEQVTVRDQIGDRKHSNRSCLKNRITPDVSQQQEFTEGSQDASPVLDYQYTRNMEVGYNFVRISNGARSALSPSVHTHLKTNSATIEPISNTKKKDCADFYIKSLNTYELIARCGNIRLFCRSLTESRHTLAISDCIEPEDWVRRVLSKQVESSSYAGAEGSPPNTIIVQRAGSA